MRFFCIVFLLFAPLLAMQFEYENSKIYKLKNDEFSIKNGDLKIKKGAFLRQSSQHQTLKTNYSQTTLTQNLRFYSHLKNRHFDARGDSSARGDLSAKNALLRVRNGRDYLLRKNVVFDLEGMENPANCYILLRSAESKILHTKSSAILLNLDEAMDAKNADCADSANADSADSANKLDSAHADSADSANELDSAHELDSTKIYFGCDGRF